MSYFDMVFVVIFLIWVVLAIASEVRLLMIANKYRHEFQRELSMERHPAGSELPEDGV